MSVRSLIRSLRRDLDIAHRSHVLRRALSEFAKNPRAHIQASDSLLQEMVYGWNNENWSANTEYLAACLTHAVASPGPILECGSGLTTIAIGILCGQTHNTMWTLEHTLEWAQKTGDYVTEYQLSNVNLRACDLKTFGGFMWYDAPIDAMPTFSLVICDGPPSNMDGGRYGLIPVMRSKLAPGAVVLLDDAERSEEQQIAGRWAAELNTTYQLVESEKPYIRMILP